jgi:hypothetical protein
MGREATARRGGRPVTAATVGLALVAAGTLALLAVAWWLERREGRRERAERQDARYRRERDAALRKGWTLTAGRIEVERRCWRRAEGAGLVAATEKEERATNGEQR